MSIGSPRMVPFVTVRLAAPRGLPRAPETLTSAVKAPEYPSGETPDKASASAMSPLRMDAAADRGLFWVARQFCSPTEALSCACIAPRCKLVAEIATRELEAATSPDRASNRRPCAEKWSMAKCPVICGDVGRPVSTPAKFARPPVSTIGGGPPTTGEKSRKSRVVNVTFRRLPSDPLRLTLECGKAMYESVTLRLSASPR